MAKQSNAARRGRQFQDDQEAGIIPFERSKNRRGSNPNAQANDCKRFEALTEAQGQYYLTMQSHPVTFSIGPAGTGKSHTAIHLGCEMLIDKKIDQFVVSRPITGVDEDMGALPGELEEKFDPFFAPVRKIMEGIIGYGRLEAYLRSGKVVVTPLQFIRGMTFDRSFMLLDEAQNATKGQMYAFLTRVGRYTTVAVDGDIEQIDLPADKPSGLVDALKRFKGHPKFGFAEFTEADIVREDIVRDVIIAYRKKLEA
jgi:phosphate starvation-inducible PhoH-like protein